MKLAIAQIVFGVLIVGCFAILFAAGWLYVFLVLGLTVLGCGIAQFLKARG